MESVALVFPPQLFPRPPGPAGLSVLLVEDPLFFGTDPRWPLRVHATRLVLHRASMTAWRDEQTAAGRDVRPVDLPAPAPGAGTLALLDAAVPRSVRVVHAWDPVDDVLARRLRRFAAMRGARLELAPNPNFLTPPEFLHAHTGGRRPFQARFYEAQRRRLNLLVEPDGTPTGGKWSFDAENRGRLPDGWLVPAEPRAAPDAYVAAAAAWVARRFPAAPGDPRVFPWPVTRSGAERWFEEFLETRLADFGTYEDAISRSHRALYHSQLTPMLNVGLLDPAGIVARTVAFARERGVPLNSLEGFLRQIVGWREFVRGVYAHHGVAERTRNFWGFTRRMPRAFYDGTTGIAPVDDTIRRVLAHGWCHHIERLMVLGNFMLLCRLHPDDVYRWFMELFVDAYDWVMVPNVYGMSQFADGGLFATKPYLGGSNYIRKMSDYGAGPWTETWDALFWSFIGDHEPVFAANHRLVMLARNWSRFPAEKQAAYRERAREFLDGLDR